MVDAIDIRSGLTVDEADNMRHALGLNQHGVTKPYRNRFWTDPQSADAEIWAPLVERGLAWRSAPRAAYAGSVMFAVTDAGMAALGVSDFTGLEASERFAHGLQKTSEASGT